MEKESNNVSLFFTGLLVGGVLGSVFAMLYTPFTGKKMRRNISKTTGDLLDDVNDYIETGKDKADEIFTDGKKKADEIIKDGKKKASALIDEAKKIVSN